MFGLVIAGRTIIAEFLPQSETRCISTVIDNAASVAEVSFFMMPGAVLPPGFGALLYYSTGPAFNEWEVIGGIGPGRPSGIFRTGWNTRVSEGSSLQFDVQFGISIEPLETMENLEIAAKGVEDRLGFARKIAENLFNFMTSFSQSMTPGLLQVPADIFDRWMSVFESKFKRDPNFFIK